MLMGDSATNTSVRNVPCGRSGSCLTPRFQTARRNGKSIRVSRYAIIASSCSSRSRCAAARAIASTVRSPGLGNEPAGGSKTASIRPFSTSTRSTRRASRPVVVSAEATACRRTGSPVPGTGASSCASPVSRRRPCVTSHMARNTGNATDRSSTSTGMTVTLPDGFCSWRRATASARAKSEIVALTTRGQDCRQGSPRNVGEAAASRLAAHAPTRKLPDWANEL